VTATRKLKVGRAGAMIVGLDVAPDLTAYVLLTAIENTADGATHRLVKIGSDSREQSVAVEMPIDTRRHPSAGGFVSIRGAEILTAINYGHVIDTATREIRRNTFGLVEVCWTGDAATLVLLSGDQPTEARRLRIEKFQLREAVPITSGWLLVGDSREGCGLERHAAAFMLTEAFELRQIWRDSSPYQTLGKSIRPTPYGFEIVGYAERTIAIGESAGVSNAEPKQGKEGRVPYVSDMRFGNEGRVSGEVFSVALSRQGYEEGRDFVGAGFPVVPNGVVSSGGKSAVFGTVGSRLLWMER